MGTGQGVSVLEMVQAFARASGLDINYKLVTVVQVMLRNAGLIRQKHTRIGLECRRTIDDMTRQLALAASQS